MLRDDAYAARGPRVVDHRQTARGFRLDRVLVGGRSRAADRSSMWRELATLVANYRGKKLGKLSHQTDGHPSMITGGAVDRKKG